MAAAVGPGPTATAGWIQTFTELVSHSPQPLPEVEVPFRPAKLIDGELCVIFSKEEIERSASPFKYSMVLKFLKQRPSLDNIRAFIRSRWGLGVQPVISAMRKPRNVFVQFANEADFLKALSREATDVDGVSYRGFHWHPDFDEDTEPALVPVWICLPGLLPNYYHESFLKIITAPLGRFLRRDNATKCTTRTDGARVCLEMDVSKEPINGLWIGMPHLCSSFYIEIEYETLPAFCSYCRIQGHNINRCIRKGGVNKANELKLKRSGKLVQVWKPQKTDLLKGNAKEVDLLTMVNVVENSVPIDLVDDVGAGPSNLKETQVLDENGFEKGCREETEGVLFVQSRVDTENNAEINNAQTENIEVTVMEFHGDVCLGPVLENRSLEVVDLVASIEDEEGNVGRDGSSFLKEKQGIFVQNYEDGQMKEFEGEQMGTTQRHLDLALVNNGEKNEANGFEFSAMPEILSHFGFL